MRLSFALALCLLAAGFAVATPPFVVDELPQPFGGTMDTLKLSESGLVAGCMERGEDDWLPFAWDRARGLRLIDSGYVGNRHSCSTNGVTADGLVGGRIPGPSGAVPFVWSEAHGLLLFDDQVYYGPHFNTAGQLAVLGANGRILVWTETEGRIEIEPEHPVWTYTQTETGMLWGVMRDWPMPETRFFVWSRERGLATFLEHDAWIGPQPSIQLLSDDGWAAGRLSVSEDQHVAYVRAPNGTFHTFSLGGESVAMTAIGSDGLVVGSGETKGGNYVAFAYQPGFGVEALGPGAHPTTSDLARGVNASNVVVGQAVDRNGVSRGFVWERGKGTEMIGLGGARDVGRTINDAGWVLGHGFNQHNQNGLFVWSHETGALEIPWPNEHIYPGVPIGANATGMVVGFGQDPPGNFRPWVFVPQLGVFDPSEWLPPLGANSIYPHALTDAGRLIIGGESLDDGHRRYFLLSPAPPASPD